MTATVALGTRDVRAHGHPMLAAAVLGADAVVPLFVRDFPEQRHRLRGGPQESS